MPQNLPNLNDSITKIPSEAGKGIPSKVARSDKIIEHDNQKIVFTFLEYKHNQCEIHQLQKPAETRKLTSELKKINRTPVKNIFCQEASGVACKRAHDGGEYSNLSNDLPPDAQLLEIDYSGAGRIFGYLSENIFNIVSIKKKHLK